MTNEQTTGDDGKATFQLEYGDYTATISKDGYVTKTENIAFRSNHKNFTIEIAEVEIGDYNYVVNIDEDTITGTLNIGEQDQYGSYLVDIITSSDPNFVTTDGMGIGDTIVADGFTELYLNDYDGEVGTITLIGRENVSIQTLYDGSSYSGVDVMMATEQLDFSDIDWSKVVGMGYTGGEYGVTLIYEIDSTTHEQTETVATITNGTYYVYATFDDLDGEAIVTVTDTHRSFTITLQEDTPTGTGTVTVTGVDSENNPTNMNSILLYTGEMPTQQDDSNLVAFGSSSSNDSNVVQLHLWDTTTHQSTDDSNIPFGTYNIYADNYGGSLTYNGTLTVDGNEEITITLTSE